VSWTANAERYNNSPDWFRRCGRSGLMLPAISLGCWHNFGDAGCDAGHHADESSMHENCRQMLFTAFDSGITHFDLANNYGPQPGAAEIRVGRILREDLAHYRDELIISTKAGYRMWPGPYGEWGSRKYLLASLDQSLKRLGLDYVDIFYSHRFDPGTPLEETLFALDSAVRSGKALYVGISSYNGMQIADVTRLCQTNGWVQPIILQPMYSMLERNLEQDALLACQRYGLGSIAFCPLAQGLLTGKYLTSIPDESRVRQVGGFLKEDSLNTPLREKLTRLNDLALQRGQTLAQMALAWVLRPQSTGVVTSALIGASRSAQITENVACMKQLSFSAEELAQLDAILG